MPLYAQVHVWQRNTDERVALHITPQQQPVPSESRADSAIPTSCDGSPPQSSQRINVRLAAGLCIFTKTLLQGHLSTSPSQQSEDSQTPLLPPVVRRQLCQMLDRPQADRYARKMSIINNSHHSETTGERSHSVSSRTSATCSTSAVITRPLSALLTCGRRAISIQAPRSSSSCAPSRTYAAVTAPHFSSNTSSNIHSHSNTLNCPSVICPRVVCIVSQSIHTLIQHT